MYYSLKLKIKSRMLNQIFFYTSKPNISTLPSIYTDSSSIGHLFSLLRTSLHRTLVNMGVTLSQTNINLSAARDFCLQDIYSNLVFGICFALCSIRICKNRQFMATTAYPVATHNCASIVAIHYTLVIKNKHYLISSLLVWQHTEKD